MGRRGGRPPKGALLAEDAARWDEHIRWLFLRTYEDLARRSAIGAERYTVLGAAPLLRKLLLDSPRLLDEANRRGPGLRFTFRARQLPPEDPPEQKAGMTFVGEMLGEGLDPDTDEASTPVVELSRDGWLNHTVVQLSSGPATVRDVIVQAANVEGGVHVTTPNEERQHRLLELSLLTGLEVTRLTDAGLALPGTVTAPNILSPIGRVTVAGIAPLYRALR